MSNYIRTYVIGREAEARREDSFQWIPNSGIYYNNCVSKTKRKNEMK